MSLFPGQGGPLGGKGPTRRIPGVGFPWMPAPAGPPAADPGTPRPRPAALDPSAPQWKSAYPGSTTYLDLIRKNKAESALLVAAMLTLGALLGAVTAAVIAGGATGQGEASILAGSAVVGGIVALGVGGIGALWSWFGGANAILRMTGARPIEKPQDPELFNVVDELRIAAGVPMPKVYLVRSDSLNAFATGRDPKHAVVAITTGLRRVLTRDELQGVMAHEMAHVRHYDIRFAMLMATMVGLIAFASEAMLRSMRHVRIGGSSDRSSKGGGAAVIVLLVVWLLLAILAPIVAQVIHFAFSRSREYLADAGAVELTRNPLGLASALQKLSDCRAPLETANSATQHLFIVNPTAKACLSGQRKSSVFSTHPPIDERIRRLLALTR